MSKSPFDASYSVQGRDHLIPLKNTKFVDAKPHKEPPFYICPEDIDDFWYKARDQNPLMFNWKSEIDAFYKDIYKKNAY